MSSTSTRAVVVKTIRLSEPDHAFYGVWNADSTRIALGFSLHRRVAVFEFPSGRRLSAPADQAGGVSGLAYSPDGRYLAAARGEVRKGAERFTVSLWDATTSAHLENLIEPDASEMPIMGVSDLVFSPDSRYLAVAYSSGVILYAIDPSRGSRRLIRLRSSARVAFSPDGTLLATARGLDASIHEVPSGRLAAKIPRGGTYSIAFRPDGQQFGMCQGPRIRFFQTADWQEIASVDADAAANAVAVRYLPDGRHFVVGVDRVVQIWSVATGARIATLTEHGARPINTVAVSSNGRFVAAFGGGIVTVWELVAI